MSPRTRACYYEEMKSFAEVFGLPRRALPADLRGFDRYLAGVVPLLHVTREARGLAFDVLDPPAPAALKPAVAIHRLVTIGLLPPSLRRGFGLSWSPAQE